ncbi:putative SP-containing membrane protein [Vairimorpha necatrix]|uniref:SP-containing membrane protein n=1 Tax=Vairimorpha necatrix TaxID=6039 RepID=A0AAX4JCF5_9MICR
MKFEQCFSGLFYLFLGVKNASDSMSDILHDMINSNLTKDQLCDSLDNKVGGNGLSLLTVRIYSELFWETITNHKIFKDMVQNDVSIYSFVNLRYLLKDGYVELIRQLFRIIKWDPYSLDFLSMSEKKFIYELVEGTLHYYNVLRLCYKDIINNSNSTKETIENIITENTCFLPKDANGQFSSFVYKMCDGLYPYYMLCYQDLWMNYTLNDLRNNFNSLSKSECTDNALVFKNITDYVNSKMNNITEDLKIQPLHMYTEENTSYNGKNGIKLMDKKESTSKKSESSKGSTSKESASKKSGSSLGSTSKHSVSSKGVTSKKSVSSEFKDGSSLDVGVGSAAFSSTAYDTTDITEPLKETNSSSFSDVEGTNALTNTYVIRDKFDNPVRELAFQEKFGLPVDFTAQDVRLYVFSDGFTVCCANQEPESSNIQTNSFHQLKYTRMFDRPIREVYMEVVEGTVLVVGEFADYDYPQ